MQNIQDIFISMSSEKLDLGKNKTKPKKQTRFLRIDGYSLPNILLHSLQFSIYSEGQIPTKNSQLVRGCWVAGEALTS
jgi:hypothetical protein